MAQSPQATQELGGGKPNILTDFSRIFFSAYRPIIIKLYSSDTNVAYMRAELLINTSGDPSSGYNSTGVLMNGYEDGGGNRYNFNVMEYCRPYVGEGIVPVIAPYMPSFPSYNETARFKLSIWPVRYSSINEGVLYDDLDNAVNSESFIAVSTTTNELESTSLDGRYSYVDRFVLGANAAGGQTPICRPLTNMQYTDGSAVGRYDWSVTSTSILGNSIDMSDSPMTGIYYLNANTNYDSAIVYATDGVTGVLSGTIVQIYYPSNTEVNMHRIPTHPTHLATFIDFHLGFSWNKIIDASGNLVAGEVNLILMSGGFLGGGNFWGSQGSTSIKARYQSIKYTDRKNKKGAIKCNAPKTRFHFQNHLGGYDFFNCYGTKDKTVSVKSTRYEKFNEYDFVGLRGRKELWTKREDSVKVMTQPINENTAIWLEELIASPLVWVEEKIENLLIGQVNYGLQPVSIVPGSYNVFNTEDNISYMEFKYTLSNARHQHRG
tara:strand:+ start:6069 stop:7541 length:1473 start_codon:yes stop_codon:yes gene_type:complete